MLIKEYALVLEMIRTGRSEQRQDKSVDEKNEIVERLVQNDCDDQS